MDWLANAIVGDSASSEAQSATPGSNPPPALTLQELPGLPRHAWAAIGRAVPK